MIVEVHCSSCLRMCKTDMCTCLGMCKSDMCMCLGMCKTDMCVCFGMCTNAMCWCSNLFFQMFFTMANIPWYLPGPGCWQAV